MKLQTNSGLSFSAAPGGVFTACYRQFRAPDNRALHCVLLRMGEEVASEEGPHKGWSEEHDIVRVEESDETEINKNTENYI